MRYINLDQIVRSILLKKQLSIHWYVQYLKLAADCFRELTYHHLHSVEAVVLDLDETSAIKLPGDYVDWVNIGVGCRQIQYPLVQYPDIKRLPNKDKDGFSIPYGIKVSDDVYYVADQWALNVNSHGEYIGREFGAGQSSYGIGFKEIRERGIIQLSEAFAGNQVILEYIGDGSSCNSASRIHPYAQESIENYIDWQGSPGKTSNFSPEGQKYYRSVEILRASLDSLTTHDIVSIIERARHQSIR